MTSFMCMISTCVMNRNVHAGVSVSVYTIIVDNSLYDTKLPIQYNRHCLAYVVTFVHIFT